MKRVMLYGLGIVVLALIIYGGIGYVLPTKIVGVYEGNDEYKGWTFIVLKNPPITEQGMLDFWIKNKKLLGEKYQVNVLSIRRIVFLQSRFEEYNHIGDYQFCFDQIKNKENCIAKDYRLLSIGKYPDNELYFSLPDSMCSFDRSSKDKNIFKCH